MALKGNYGFIRLGYNNIPNNGATKSFSFWYTVTTYSVTLAYFNIISLASSTSTQIGSRTPANRLIAWRFGGTTIVDSLVAPATGVMHHCAYTYDGVDASKIYVDGALANSATNAESAGVIDAVQFFGNQYGEFGTSTMDDFRVYNRELSLGEIQTIYNCRGFDDIYYGLISRWRLNEQATDTILVSAPIIKDSTLSDNTGISIDGLGSTTDYTYAESKIRYHRKFLQ